MSVTIEDFERYRKLSNDARKYEREIKMLRKKNNNRVKDKVVGSMKKPPYIKRSVTVQGLINNSRAIKKRESELAIIRAELLTLGARINGYLKTVKDSEVRDVLILHYIDGVTYRQLPQYLGLEGDGSVLMRRAKAYVNRT